ncbi:MAG: hypothetical protein AB7F89_18260, partial [Pirellulaceae bacterium]
MGNVSRQKRGAEAAPGRWGETSSLVARRWFLQQCGNGLGATAHAELLGVPAFAAPTNPLAARPPHHPPRVKNVIFLFM